MDEFDFTGGRVEATPNRPDGSTGRLFLRVLGVVALAAGVLAPLGEWDFWWLTVAGRRASAEVVGREEVVVGYAVNRVGRAFPIVHTEVRYAFTDPDGVARKGAFRVAGRGGEWHPGDRVAVMFPAVDPAASRPASPDFYWRHDVPWFTIHAVAAGGLVVAALCGALLLRGPTPEG